MPFFILRKILVNTHYKTTKPNNCWVLCYLLWGYEQDARTSGGYELEARTSDELEARTSDTC